MKGQYEYIKFNAPNNINAFITGIRSVQPHWHKEIEIMYVKYGEVDIVVNEEIYHLHPDDMLLINSDEVHTIHPREMENELWFLQINTSSVTSLAEEEIPIWYDSKRIFEDKSSESIAGRIRKMLKQLFDELLKQETAYELEVTSIVAQILVLLSRNYLKVKQSEEEVQVEENQRCIRNVLEYINAHLQEEISMNSLAKQYYVSKFHLTHLFKSYTGTTFTQYVNGLRVNKSLKLLQNLENRILDISYECGYTSAKSFNNAFRQVMGITPSEYRKSNKRDVDSKTKEEKDEKLNYNSLVGDYIQAYYTSDKGYTKKEALIELRKSFRAERGGAVKVKVDVEKQTTKINPVWKRLTTAGRAHEALRSSWRGQLEELQKEMGFEYMRFHCLLNDEMAVALAGEEGEIRYNFTYVDEVFDYMLSVGIKPFVELAFMPTVLASGEKTIFWWKGNISMPKEMDEWKNLIHALMAHCIERYGREEVLSWYFEVWNESNLNNYFFDGTFEDYMELYKHTVEVIKNIDERFRVGGPASSNFKNGEAPWVKAFLKHCGESQLPVDFISTHPYPNNFPITLDAKEGFLECYRHKDALKEDLTWLNQALAESEFPDAEIHITEWNSSAKTNDYVHDTAFMAPFLIRNNLNAQGLTHSLGYWVFTDIFEEKSPSEFMFHGGFGLINKLGLKKSAYWAYVFLGKLGSEILERTDDYIITKSKEGYQILAYNYCHYINEFAEGNREKLDYFNRYDIFEEKADLEFTFELEGLKTNKVIATKYTLDREHGSIFDKWIRNGCLEYPTKEELEVLEDLAKPKRQILHKPIGEEANYAITVKPHGVVMIDIKIKEEISLSRK